jgi:hypothetical protein
MVVFPLGQGPPTVLPAKAGDVANKKPNVIRKSRTIPETVDGNPIRTLTLDHAMIDSPVRQARRGKFAARSPKTDLGKATEVIVNRRCGAG